MAARRRAAALAGAMAWAGAAAQVGAGAQVGGGASMAPALASPPTATAPPFYALRFEKAPSAAAMTAVGRALFMDPALSPSGKSACSSCHDAARAFAPRNDAAVQLAGADGRRPGVRAVPSLMYAQNAPPFTEHYFEDEGDDGIDQGPAGGRTWDGRAASAHEQAELPLLSPFEMANASRDAVVARLRSSRSASALRDAFGAHVLDDEAAAFQAMVMALETYQESPDEFAPYTSKFDAWLRGEASLSPAETRGLAAFSDPARGNCARCHPSGRREGAFPAFTDFGYAAIGVPRNRAIPANRDPRYFDLGLCGPLRTDLADRPEYCGMFRTPTLRNVATRRVFFHNGMFKRLDQAVRFYAERDTAPERWYPRDAQGRVSVLDDLPKRYRGNVDRQAPLDRNVGEQPRLRDGDVEDIVAFLGTLTDGYRR